MESKVLKRKEKAWVIINDDEVCEFIEPDYDNAWVLFIFKSRNDAVNALKKESPAGGWKIVRCFISF